METFQAVKWASIFGVIGNVFLLIIKGSIGFISNSQSMIADAMNSAGDIFSSIMTFVGNKVASKPSDDDHNLGHGKAEYIYSMFISITMGFMACQVARSAFWSLFNRGEYTFSIWLVIVCIVTILVKFFLYLYTRRLYKKHHNLLIEANSKDHRNDCVITLLNLVACLLSLKNIYLVDGVVGIVIAVWIFITAVKIFKESYDVLMDKSIDLEAKEKVYEIIRNHPEVQKVTHFNSTPVGYRYQISFTIYVDGNLSTFESHGIANSLEKEIDKKFPEIYLAVIHVNPMQLEKTRKKLKKNKRTVSKGR